MTHITDLLAISPEDVASVNQLLTSPDIGMTQALCDLIDTFGGVKAINEKARKAGRPENLMHRLKQIGSPYLSDLEWLMEQRDRHAFVPMNDFCRSHTGSDASSIDFSRAVTLEISALQFFPWLIAQARHCIENKELMPGRFIRVRCMKEQAEDNGDLMATAAAMQIIGATWVESLDTRGTDGGNVHLGGPDTITGYFAGIGQPNDYPLKWASEYLHYYTEFGIKQVLNVNPGTILMGYMMHRMGIDIEFKISVFVGNDNPWFILWTLMTARMFARNDGSTPLAGFNLSNSVNNDTIAQADMIRKKLGLEDAVRFEHHITETFKSIVIQPYNRRDELVELAKSVANISAKHEGGDPYIESQREHPSDILEYFLTRDQIEQAGLMPALETNYLDKHHAMNLTAQALLKAGIGVVAARNLHQYPETRKHP